MDYPAEFQQKFQVAFGAPSRVFCAPGRVNLIGEHTDYNDGFVMPAAIDLSTHVAIAPRDDRMLVIASEGFDDAAEFNLDRHPPRGDGHWSDYVRGVASELLKAGFKLRGANLLIASTVPTGSGLSSSAAVEVASALALLSVADATLDGVEVAKLCQRRRSCSQPIVEPATYSSPMSEPRYSSRAASMISASPMATSEPNVRDCARRVDACFRGR